MRALLVVNQHATSTTPARREVIARALASMLDLEVIQTRYRGHAWQACRAAAAQGVELVVTLGGDGTVNEAVNGILGAAPPSVPDGGLPGHAEPDGGLPAPALATLPGGHANVFTRALGMPADPVEATGQLLDALAEKRHRTVGVGQADSRYFCFNAGLGLDAEVVRAVEWLRARGQPVSSALYVWTAAHHFFAVTDRRQPALTLECDGQAAMDGLYCAFISNTSPWTYLGPRPVNANPLARFDTGLDMLGMRKLGTVDTLNTLRQMLSRREAPLRGRHLVNVHDAPSLAFRAGRPVAFQVDGEYVGERESVTFRAIPDALRVIV